MHDPLEKTPAIPGAPTKATRRHAGNTRSAANEGRTSTFVSPAAGPTDSSGDHWCSEETDHRKNDNHFAGVQSNHVPSEPAAVAQLDDAEAQSSNGDQEVTGAHGRISNRVSEPDTESGPIAQEDHIQLAAERAAQDSNGGHPCPDTHPESASVAVACVVLRELHKQRQDLHRAEKSLTLQIKAKCRRAVNDGQKELKVIKAEGDRVYRAMMGKAPEGEEPRIIATGEALLQVCAPFLSARALIKPERTAVERQMAKQAATLPVAEWVSGVRGLGLGSLAAIVGEAGDIGTYTTVSRLWKRMGLAVVGGERQRKHADAEKALEHGYNPSRRSVMWSVGASVFKAQSERTDKKTGKVTPPGEYRQVYDTRKEYELSRGLPKGHAHNRSTRYMEKRILRDLWRAWREAMRGTDTHLGFASHHAPPKGPA